MLFPVLDCLMVDLNYIWRDFFDIIIIPGGAKLECPLPGYAVVIGKNQPVTGPAVRTDNYAILQNDQIRADSPVSNLCRRGPAPSTIL